MTHNITLGLTIRIALLIVLAALAAASPLLVSAATPDPVLEWIGIMNNSVIAGGTNPLVTTRVVALVSASVFDAVNGIEPRFQPLHVKPNAPNHASQRAAAIQAAFTILLNLYPAQSATPRLQRSPQTKKRNRSTLVSLGGRPWQMRFGPGD
jgi:hypothetical protein